MEITILGNKMRVELIILCLLVGAFIGGNVFCNCAGGVREGLQIIGAAVDYTMNSGEKNAGGPPESEKNVFQTLESNNLGSVSDGQMSIFADNKMAPECCPAAYSGSTGCVCATPEQMKFISRRGQNNTISSV